MYKQDKFRKYICECIFFF